MEDFYENNLLPKMFAFPHQYVARIIANNNRAKGTGGGPAAHLRENLETFGSGSAAAAQDHLHQLKE